MVSNITARMTIRGFRTSYSSQKIIWLNSLHY